MNIDMQYIARHVATWPSNELHYVRLDEDGEICFTSETRTRGTEFDFYPEQPGKKRSLAVALEEYEPHPCFLPREYGLATGTEYARADWETARGILT